VIADLSQRRGEALSGSRSVRLLHRHPEKFVAQPVHYRQDESSVILKEEARSGLVILTSSPAGWSFHVNKV
jgi:hypothetical protein